ncbi:MAG: pantoate--beta-alanine ligase [Sphingobacteriaceae bacterium]
MKIFKTRSGISAYILMLRKKGKTIGFVPTMGALHRGHLSLIEEASNLTDCVICSIFVNPTQFNDPNDLAKYPRPLKADILLLEKTACEVLFLPEVEEIYPKIEKWHIELGKIEDILEGKSRPGHYQGVTQVVFQLFKIIEPNMAFFGQKDFQQCLIIQKMIDVLNLPVQLNVRPIIREDDGLAMSSRNVHLNQMEREHAVVLSKTLIALRNAFDPKNIEALKQTMTELIEGEPMVQLDYLEILNANTLDKVQYPASEPMVALIAAKVGKTRLIDNTVLP